MEMEDAFQDLFRLIEEANRAFGLNCPCMITARAYLRLAEDATFELLEHVFDDDEYTRLRASCDYSQEFCLQERDLKGVAYFMVMFWHGVYDGFFGNSQNDEDKYYIWGYKKIKRRA
jgi:hypothetical protein